MENLPRIMIAGTHSGVGKTTVTLGLMSALTQRGYKVQGFKVGPDYIDPGHHTAVTGNISRNLDTWMMGTDVCIKLFKRSAAKAYISVIEGVMGLYDGHLDEGEVGSSAHIAKILNTPVILVVDAKGMARSAGAVVLGYMNFDPGVKIAGVILNNIASTSHFEAVRSSIEDVYKKIPPNPPLVKGGKPLVSPFDKGGKGGFVLGYLPKNAKITIPERHLGLVTAPVNAKHNSYEAAPLRLLRSARNDKKTKLPKERHCEGTQVPEAISIVETYHKIGNLLAATVDIDKILEIVKESCEL